MNIEYKITFYGDWHCGSGLTSGAALDLLVVKDRNNLPFVPGKTIKGLLNEAATEINKFEDVDYKECINKIFGVEAGSSEEVNRVGENSNQGCCFFTNATLSEKVSDIIVEGNLSQYMYHSIASTAIDKDGVADKHSLRKIEVTIPCDLYGKILDVPEESLNLMIKSLKYIKRLGQSRNRGLGRCSFSIITEGGDQ